MRRAVCSCYLIILRGRYWKRPLCVSTQACGRLRIYTTYTFDTRLSHTLITTRSIYFVSTCASFPVPARRIHAVTTCRKKIARKWKSSLAIRCPSKNNNRKKKRRKSGRITRRSRSIKSDELVGKSDVAKFVVTSHSSFLAFVFLRGALRFRNVAIARACMPTTFADACAARTQSHLYQQYQHVSRNQFIFMMYRGSMTQRLAMLVSNQPGPAGTNGKRGGKKEGQERWELGARGNEKRQPREK